MEHPKTIGDRSTLVAMLALSEAGYAISVPFGENTRYDLIIDSGERLARVQCKTGRLHAGAIRFATCSSYLHHRSPRLQKRDYSGQIDFFAVFCPETSGIYLIPIEDVPTSTNALLRIEPARNGQRKRIRLAEKYRVTTMNASSVVVMPEPRASSGARGSSA